MSEPTVTALKTASLLHFEDNQDGGELVVEEICKKLIKQIASEIMQTLPFLPACEDCIEAVIYGGDSPQSDAPLVPCYPIRGTMRYLTINGEIVSDEFAGLYTRGLGTLDELQAIVTGLQQMRGTA